MRRSERAYGFYTGAITLGTKVEDSLVILYRSNINMYN